MAGNNKTESFTFMLMVNFKQVRHTVVKAQSPDTTPNLIIE